MKFITAIFLFLVFNSANAQVAQFWNNYSFFNPATSGLENKHFAAITYQEPFGEYAPINVYANYNTRIKGAHGVGINYSYGDFNFFRTQTASLNYNYQIKLGSSENHKLSFGVSLGIIDNNIQGFACVNCFGSPDSPTPASRVVSPNIDLGIAYLNKNLLLGVSVSQLTEPNLNNYSQLKRQYSLLGSYNFILGEKIEIKPQLVVSTDFNFHSMDFNVLAYYKKSFWTGVSYRVRLNEAASWMLGIDVKRTVRIGYSFTQTFYEFGDFRGGMHEFVLGIKLK